MMDFFFLMPTALVLETAALGIFIWSLTAQNGWPVFAHGCCRRYKAQHFPYKSKAP
jgi:hypothetical protein